MLTSERSIDITTDIAASPEQVWAALTDPAEIPRWLAPIATVRPGVGGFVELSWGAGMTGRNAIELWQPSERLTLAGEGNEALREEYRLLQHDEVTRLSLRHSGFPASPQGDDSFNAISNGWRAFFRMCQHGLARHAGQPFRNVTAFSPMRMKRDTAWKALSQTGVLAVGGLPKFDEGQQYRLKLTTGQVLSGSVLHCAWPGYLVLTADTFGDSLFAVFCERNGDESFLTITWILNGDAIKHEDRLRTEWTEWVSAAQQWKVDHALPTPAPDGDGTSFLHANSEPAGSVKHA